MQSKQARRRLEDERARLQRIREDIAAAGVGAAAGPPGADELSQYGQHPGDLGSETFEQEKNASVLEQVDAQLDEVELALRRLDGGRYGSCEACGQPITAERLEALPATRFCVTDQARAEREAGVAGRRR